MDINLSKWFKNYKQMLIVLVYVTIVTLYVLGFGWQYTVMYNDHGEQAFAIGFDKPVTYGTFIYYSIVSFTTIGYGEITPLSTAARLFTGVQAMMGMIINVVFVAILLLYISNFQAFIKTEQEEHRKEEKEIRALRRAITKKKSR